MNQQIDYVAAQRAGEVSIPFAAELFGRVASAAKADANVFVSPYSVGTALALTLEGAKGDTAGQLKKAIGYGPDHDPQKLHHDIVSLIYSLNKVEGVELSVANALWVSTDFQIHQDYVRRAQELLSEARNLDFNTQSEKSRQIINSWVEEKTKDKIKDLLPAGSIKPGVPLVITNAIYFKGAWAHAFKKSSTQDQDFHLLGNAGTKTVKMMEQNKLKTRHGSFADHAMVQLPYKGQDIVMLIMLPHENSPSALQAVVSEENLRKINHNQRSMQQSEVNIKLPRFKFEYEVELADLLQEMGISLPFTNDADFSAMVAPDSPAEQLRIGKVFHKAFVEVNEEGTEAAAATAVVMLRCMAMAPSSVIDFVVDRPFAFVIYNARLQCPLFVGKVVDPTA